MTALVAVPEPEDPRTVVAGTDAEIGNDAAEYEAQLLAAILQGYEDLPTITRVLGANGDAFMSGLRGGIFEAMVEVHKKGFKPDPITVRDQVLRSGLRVDPHDLVELLTRPGVITESAPHYAERVRELSRLRKIGGLGARMQQASQDLTADSATILGYVQGWAGELLADDRGEVVDPWTALEAAIVEPGVGDPMRVLTGWRSLNNIIGGFYPGQMVVIAGRPGRGKSIAMENLSTDIARCPGLQTLYVSMEMEAKELTQRTLAYVANVNLTKIRTGEYDNDEAARLAAAASEIADIPREIIDSAYVTVDDIRAYAWAAKQRAVRAGRRLAAIFVDYSGLVILDEGKNVSRQQAIGRMTRALKRLAKELGITVVIGVQLLRGVEGRTDRQPMLSDLREAGDYEQDADIVILLHPNEIEQDGRIVQTDDTDFIVAKDRSGPTGTCTVHFYGEFTRFWEA